MNPKFRCETPKSPPGDYNSSSCGGCCDCCDWARCETPKSPPGDYNVPVNSPVFDCCRSELCETPKSPPGDYNRSNEKTSVAPAMLKKCETPKSPPGDYNSFCGYAPPSSTASVKHLNPRQGITILAGRGAAPVGPHSAPCETPKSPPGDYNHLDLLRGHRNRVGSPCVKHLNPRQGITIKTIFRSLSKWRMSLCETPKSPPGDYNLLC
mgnify:CR=1 FL=1